MMLSEVLFDGYLPISVQPSAGGYTPSSTLPRPSTELQAQLLYSSVDSTLTLTLSDFSTRLLLLHHNLTAETYAEFRDTQSLRIDFTSFRGHLVELIQKPVTSSDFVAVLVLPDEEHRTEPVLLRIVQLSAYKAITHIELPFERASQQQLITALAERARIANSARDRTERLLRVVEEKDNALLQLKEEVESLRTEAAQLNHQRQETQTLQIAREQDAAVISELREVLGEKEGQLEELQKQAGELDQVTEQTHELNTAIAEEKRLREEEQHKHSDVSNRLTEMEERAENLQKEVDSGKDVIGKLQTEVKSLKAKSMVKSAVIAKQETAVEAQEARIATLERDVRRVRDRAAMLEVEKEGLSGRLSSACNKLEENAAVLANDQQVIAYLNRELNNRIITGGDSGAVLTPSPSAGLQRREDWDMSIQGRQRSRPVSRDRTASPGDRRNFDVQTESALPEAIS